MPPYKSQIVAEKLAVENRSIRGELEQYLAREARRPSDHEARGSLNTGDSYHETAEHPPLKTVSAGIDSGGNGGRTEPANGGAWEGMLQAQVGMP